MHLWMTISMFAVELDHIQKLYSSKIEQVNVQHQQELFKLKQEQDEDPVEGIRTAAALQMAQYDTTSLPAEMLLDPGSEQILFSQVDPLIQTGGA